MSIIYIRAGGFPVIAPWDGRSALYSRDSGKTFQQTTLGLPSSVQIRHLLQQGNNLYAATSRGIYVADITTNTTRNYDVTFSALRCTPNPAQDAVSVRYAVAAASTVRIEILDILGLPTHTEEHATGEQTITFPVTAFSSGVYTVRLTIHTNFNGYSH